MNDVRDPFRLKQTSSKQRD